MLSGHSEDRPEEAGGPDFPDADSKINPRERCYVLPRMIKAERTDRSFMPFENPPLRCCPQIIDNNRVVLRANRKSLKQVIGFLGLVKFLLTCVL